MKLPAIFAATMLLLCGCHNDDVYYEVAPPFAGVTPATDTIQIDPAKEQKVTMPGGTIVNIPANAFTDASGKTVTQPVQLTFTNYNTQASILASGLPMKYNEGGREFDFESAGMFDIQGYAGGEQINIAPDKKLEISYPSAAQGEYDFFKLDEIQGVKGAGPGVKSTQARSGKWRKLTANRNDTSKTIKNFRLRFNTEAFPQLVPPADANWHLATQFADPAAPENKWVLDTAWEYLEISKPRYVTGKVLLERKAILEYPGRHVSVTADGRHYIIPHDSGATIWNYEKGKSIDINANFMGYAHAEADFLGSNRFDNDYIFTYKDSASFCYSMQGVQLGRLPGMYYLQIAPKKRRVVYTKHKGGEKLTTIVIASIAGSTIKELPIPTSSDEHFIPYINNRDEIIAHGTNSVTVYDIDGNILRERKGGFESITLMGNDSILLNGIDDRLEIWNFVKNTTMRSPETNVNDEDYVRPIENTPYVAYEERRMTSGQPERSRLWNYKTNKLSTPLLISYINICNDDPNVVYGYSGDASELRVYNMEQEKQIISFKDEEGDYYWPHKVYAAPGSRRILVNFEDDALLYNYDGKLIAKLTGSDSLVLAAGFVNDHTIFTVSEYGVYRQWDISGRLLQTKKTDNAGYVSVEWNDEVLKLTNVVTGITYLLDKNGNLLFNSAKYPLINSYKGIAGNKSIVQYGPGEYNVAEVLQREEAAYQLTVKKGYSEFTTCVYMDSKTASIINNYQAFRQEYMNTKYAVLEETRRMEKKKRKAEYAQWRAEDTLVRIFAIAEFGIYNYDRIIETDQRLFFAADFKLPGITDENITVFLVTSMDGNAVVKYYRDAWKQFSIDTTAKNTLIAVLPGNEIAICTEEELKRINWADVANNKSYTFDMKRTGKKISSMKDIEELLGTTFNAGRLSS